MSGSTLRDEGFRYLVSKDLSDFGWVHPAEVADHADWIDCTDMSHEEFDAFYLLGSHK